jgi:hypothetical protein
VHLVQGDAGIRRDQPLSDTATELQRQVGPGGVGDPTDREGYRGVLPLIGLLPESDRGLPASEWYRASETSSPELTAAYDRYANIAAVPDGDGAR